MLILKDTVPGPENWSFLLFKRYLFIWLCQVLVARGIFSLRDLLLIIAA